MGARAQRRGGARLEYSRQALTAAMQVVFTPLRALMDLDTMERPLKTEGVNEGRALERAAMPAVAGTALATDMVADIFNSRSRWQIL